MPMVHVVSVPVRQLVAVEHAVSVLAVAHVVAHGAPSASFTLGSRGLSETRGAFGTGGACGACRACGACGVRGEHGVRAARGAREARGSQIVRSARAVHGSHCSYGSMIPFMPIARFHRGNRDSRSERSTRGVCGDSGDILRWQSFWIVNSESVGALWILSRDDEVCSAVYLVSLRSVGCRWSYDGLANKIT